MERGILAPNFEEFLGDLKFKIGQFLFQNFAHNLFDIMDKLAQLVFTQQRIVNR